MTDKPDPYQVLGVARSATEDDIKKAHKKIMMQNHPDMVRARVKDAKLLPKALADADVKFKQANEAEKILSDAKLRAAYDQFGHKGVENALAGKNASSGQSYTDAAGKITVKKHYTEEDLMDFFGKSKDRREREEAKTADDGLTPEQRRQRAYEERMARRRGGNPPATTSATPQPEKSSAANAFHVVAEKVDEAAQKLRDGVEVPLTALEKFRDNLADFLGEVDKAINKAKGGPGPRFT
jgi:curved DNA-binding protein CbpA